MIPRPALLTSMRGVIQFGEQQFPHKQGMLEHDMPLGALAVTSPVNEFSYKASQM